MIIIRLSGGIGNQMFQYSLYLKLVSMGKEVKFDDVTEYKLDNARPVMLSVFGISYPRASGEEIVRYTDSSMNPAARIRRKLSGRQSLEYQEASADFDPKVLEKDPAYLSGCFQSEKYFSGIKQQVKEAFRFGNIRIPVELEEKVKDYEEKIENSLSVSLHIRRGDYLAANDVYGGICTEAYYGAAVEGIIKRFPAAVFYIFSNDTKWALAWREKQKEKERFHVIEGTAEDTGYIDLMLMSRCRHHIIANSSFSWWGAWLGKREGSMIIAPSVWLNTRICSDIFTEDMLRINAMGEEL